MLCRRHLRWVLVIIAAAALAACGKSTSQAPTAPTTTPSASTVSIDLNTPTPAGTPGAGFSAPVVGTVSGFAGTCPAVTFVLAGVTIHSSNATTYEGGVCADIQNGVRAGAIGDKRGDGSVDAKRVKIAPPQPPSASGLVTALSGTCPALTFTLSGTVVHTTSATVFDGGTCADVREGARAGAAGPKDASGAINAEHVKIAPPPLPSAAGVVTGLSGTCPALTFTLSGTTVHTSDRTIFEGGVCSDVKEGARAGAVGPKDASGAINAEHVKVAPPPLPSASGPVTGLTGNCPNLTFSLSGTVVHTTDKTIFDGGACGDVKDGVRAGAVGPKGSDGSIAAEHVKIAAPPQPGTTRVAGAVASTSGACPTLTFVITTPVASTSTQGQVTVRITDKTRFERGACGDIKAGAHVGASGLKAADGSIDAIVVVVEPAK